MEESKEAEAIVHQRDHGNRMFIKSTWIVLQLLEESSIDRLVTIVTFRLHGCHQVWQKQKTTLYNQDLMPIVMFLTGLQDILLPGVWRTGCYQFCFYSYQTVYPSIEAESQIDNIQSNPQETTVHLRLLAKVAAAS